MSVTFYPAATMNQLVRRLPKATSPANGGKRHQEKEGLTFLRCRRCELKLAVKLPDGCDLRSALVRPINGHSIRVERDTPGTKPAGPVKPRRNRANALRQCLPVLGRLLTHFECNGQSGRLARKGKAAA